MRVIDFHIHYIRREMLNSTWLQYLAEMNPEYHANIEHFADHPQALPELEKNAGKVIFGSDWPTMPKGIKENVAATQSLSLNEGALEAILYGNASRILARRSD